MAAPSQPERFSSSGLQSTTFHVEPPRPVCTARSTCGLSVWGCRGPRSLYERPYGARRQIPRANVHVSGEHDPGFTCNSTPRASDRTRCRGAPCATPSTCGWRGHAHGDLSAARDEGRTVPKVFIHTLINNGGNTRLEPLLPICSLSQRREQAELPNERAQTLITVHCTRTRSTPPRLTDESAHSHPPAAPPADAAQDRSSAAAASPCALRTPDAPREPLTRAPQGTPRAALQRLALRGRRRPVLRRQPGLQRACRAQRRENRPHAAAHAEGLPRGRERPSATFWAAAPGGQSTEPAGSSCSMPSRSTSRSRSSRFVNSRVMRPLRLPTSIRTGASRRLERRLVMSTTRGL